MNTASFHLPQFSSPTPTVKARAIGNALSLLIALVALSFLNTSTASAAGAAIFDEAEFFSKSAKEEASKLIAGTARELKKDLCIESLKELPKEIKNGVNPQNKAAADRMFEQFTIKQAAKRKVNGVYVLLVRQPAHMHVVVGNETSRRVFTLKDKDALVDMMLGHLRKKEFDDALLKGTRFVAATMKSNTLPGITSSDSWPTISSGSLTDMKFGWVGTALIGLFAVMLISRLIGGLFSGGSPGMGGGYPSSGGGFFSSLMGGIFGAAAGMWMYDHLFGHQGGQSAYGTDPSNSASDLGAQDTDYSGSGGDFNEDNSDSHQSGGDFGGGDDFGGGGDSGGGDFGGDF